MFNTACHIASEKIAATTFGLLMTVSTFMETVISCPKARSTFL